MTLFDTFKSHSGRDIYKWEHYFEAYEREFKQIANKQVNLLEIGVMRGGSLQMWKSFFDQGSIIHGIDINEKCLNFQEDNIEIHVVDQSDPIALDHFGALKGPFDIIVDDGSHRVDHQIVSMNSLWPHLKKGGVYVCEDIHTSYFTRFGGGYLKEGTFIAYLKKKIDQMHMWWSGRLPASDTEMWTRSLTRISCYPAICFFYKGNVDPPNTIWSKSGKVERETARKLSFDTKSDPQ